MVFVCFNNQSIDEIHGVHCTIPVVAVVVFFSLLDESGCFFDRCSLERLLVDLFPLHIYRYFYSVIVLSDVLVCFTKPCVYMIQLLLLLLLFS